MGVKATFSQETKKNNRAKLFSVGFFFPPSALLHPRVDIFLAFQLWMFLQRHELHNKVTIQKQGFIDNPLSASRRGWLVICCAWNRSKEPKASLQSERCILLGIPKLQPSCFTGRGLSCNLGKAVRDLRRQTARSQAALPSTHIQHFSKLSTTLA